MAKTRSFLAIDFGAFYSQEIGALIRMLKKHFTDVKWTIPEECHLTLSFFGEIEKDRILAACAAVEPLAAKHRSFSLCLDGVGAFPDFSNPKVLWAGLTGQTGSLRALKKDIDESLNSVGIAPENREFHPHLTLGRVRSFHRSSARGVAPEALHFNSNRSFLVSQITVFKSELGPQGALHTALETFRLLPVEARNP